MDRLVLTKAFLIAAAAGAVAFPLLAARSTTQPTTTTAPAGARTTDEGWFAPRPKTQKPPLPKKPVSVFIIPIREEISDKTFRALKRKVVRVRAGGADLVVLDMDTWGGLVTAALDIARLIKVELEDIYTVCYVRTRAVSAGALIACACDEIVITSVGKFGDAAPISFGGQLGKVQREKVETVLRKEFAESAERNGYNVALAESMVSIGREVWLVRNVRTRELRYVLRKAFRGKVRIPPGVTSAPSNPKADWELLNIVVDDGELLTMHSKEAVEYAFATGIIKAELNRPHAALLKHFGVTAEPTVMTDNWSERLVEFLTSAPVVGFLFFVAIICAYVEMHTPGFGVAGAVAILCFAILFGSRYMIGMAAWWEIALFAIGLVLLAVEVFVIPGFGVAGIAGILCCVVGLLAMIVPNAPDKWPIPQTDLDWSVFSNGLLALGVAFVMAIIAAAVLAKYLPKVPLAGRLVLARGAVAPQVGSAATEDAPIRSIQPGAIGAVQSTCRPVGTVRIGNDLVDAVAEGEFISAGTKVQVVKNEGNRLVVRAMG
ncbi:MAG: NfeD family protein [Planctomycetota bacterium]|nr:NfeD family protein [Planctomycetota bacterium]